jgi:uncharacterized protein
MKLAGRTVVVSGASSGIGREIALALARRGAHVVAAARREHLLDELAGEAAELAGTIRPVVADVTDADDRARLVEEAGHVEVLVNVAGQGWTGPVDRTPPEDVRRLFEVNVLALIDLTQRVLPQMLERREGHVCNIGSIAGFAASPPLTLYSSTKFAVQGFTEGLRRELAGRGVGVSLVAPAPTRSEFVEAAPAVGGLGEGLRGWFESGAVLPPSLSADAVVRAIEHDGGPGYGEISVPRAAGLFRISQVPGLNRVLDVVSFGLRAVTDRTAPDPVPTGEQPRPA